MVLVLFVSPPDVVDGRNNATMLLNELVNTPAGRAGSLGDVPYLLFPVCVLCCVSI